MDLQQQVAEAILNINAVGFKARQPTIFKSGIKSPVYVDNRKFPFHPDEWNKVIVGFKLLIENDGIDFDVVAGVEAAGIPHSAALGFFLHKPSVFVRKHAKDHGLKKMVEGGEVAGKRVILIEDLVSTGSSSLAGIKALRQEGAVVEDCLIIITYGFKEARQAFKEAGVKLHALTTFPAVLKEAVKLNKLNQGDKILVEDWLRDPEGWAERQGL